MDGFKKFAISVVCLTLVSILVLPKVRKNGYNAGYADGYKKGNSDCISRQNFIKEAIDSYSNEREKTQIADYKTKVYTGYQWDTEDEDDDERVVYVTRTGSKYHDIDCDYLRDSCIEITLEEALDDGYEACSVCGG